MKEMGFQRNTKQREIILKVLQGLKTHPTADELYSMVKKELPNVSLGTVYRNLEYLSSAGLINILNFGGQRRYDGFVKPHAHIRCVLCGKIDDIEIDSIKSLEDVSKDKGYEIRNFRVDMVGICPKCKRG